VKPTGMMFLHDKNQLMTLTLPLRDRRWFRGLREVAFVSILVESHGGISRGSWQRLLVESLLVSLASCCVLAVEEVEDRQGDVASAPPPHARF
jgi:hypothetical protein